MRPKKSFHWTLRHISESAAWINLFSAFRPTTHVTWRMGTSQWMFKWLGSPPPFYKPWKGKRPWMGSRGPKNNPWVQKTTSSILPKKSAKILQAGRRQSAKEHGEISTGHRCSKWIPGSHSTCKIHGRWSTGSPRPGHEPFPPPQEIARPYENHGFFPFFFKAFF